VGARAAPGERRSPPVALGAAAAVSARVTVRAARMSPEIESQWLGDEGSHVVHLQELPPAERFMRLAAQPEPTS
jgi:hypothetical protein